MLERILYISTIAAGVTDLDIRRMVAAASIGNRRRDITGMLAHCEVHFAQVLEGRTEALDDLMARIVQDPLHSDLRLALREPIDRRLFDRWSMGLLDGAPMADDLEKIYEGDMAAGDVVQRLWLQARQSRP